MKALLRTAHDPTLTLLRVALGLVMLPHGAQKMLGVFGGYGFAGTMDFFVKSGIPTVFAFLAIVAEFFGALGLITGTLSRVAAFGIASVMIVAAVTTHVPNGFFMNWFGNQKGEGIEFHLLALALAVPIVVRGGGAYSLDRWLSKERTRATAAHVV